jgi:poly(hydroxyalkanoate) depolymerase family esterase
MFGFANPPGRFEQVRDFGPNPAGLRMLAYVPAALPEKAALVVVLHGCRQDARSYAEGAGWTALARRFGFVLLLPEQTRLNNGHHCFNWFDPRNANRTGPEPASIYAMIVWMLERHRLDRGRVFVTGVSAGGAMTSTMLAAYPEIFAAGAIIAGLPYRAVDNVMDALSVMSEARSRPAAAWGALVREASGYGGPWPRVSVWHGSDDKRVDPRNAEEILKQWIDVHGLAEVPSTDEHAYGYRRRAWLMGGEMPVLESYTIFNMAHGTPISSSLDGERAGGKFLIDVGISSTQRIARFFDLIPADMEAPLPRRPSLIARVLRALGLRRSA